MLRASLPHFWVLHDRRHRIQWVLLKWSVPLVMQQQEHAENQRAELVHLQSLCRRILIFISPPLNDVLIFILVFVSPPLEFVLVVLIVSIRRG